jgi:hypothetical protein
VLFELESRYLTFNIPFRILKQKPERVPHLTEQRLTTSLLEGKDLRKLN